jgi:uncharacterized protein (TIGR02145 family)
VNVTVFASGSNDPCPGILKDYRDDSSYPTFLSGGGGTARCWMAANLNFGSVVNDKLVQSDNCLYEKYCPQNLETQCAATGGFYQWGEIMEYNETNLCQDLCPPGWHLPSAAEWNQLIDDFGGPGFAGGTLKDPLLPNSFSGLLSGIYYFNSQWAFSSGSVTGTMFWTSDALPGLRAGAHGLNYFNPSVSTYSPSHANALSVRCIRN